MVFNRVYRLEIQSVMLLFSTPLVYCCPSTFSLTFPIPKVTVQYIQTISVGDPEPDPHVFGPPPDPDPGSLPFLINVLSGLKLCLAK